ncbi:MULTISPECIES: DUF7827 domain-containing protein [Halomicrobium]|uniref:DUF7827 domain-containing protein n=2 Tax=Halomicrobium mukohataei TaxID=57705 RepID=C7NWR1_HALMD|nr:MULTISPECIES: hypothetical protein [Halomicrobium]ACV48271.1 hypothetical protein Hmuk_2158 [Halomicrobium mukohataei DSM 12286]QCD66689.1 hypothetical protein E5139_13935 [Halomicrobium mukohataei]QFR21495.1 hypothetical protein GBQ70_13950 [Halomicrobium sp. ZPS1]
MTAATPGGRSLRSLWLATLLVVSACCVPGLLVGTAAAANSPTAPEISGNPAVTIDESATRTVDVSFEVTNLNENQSGGPVDFTVAPGEGVTATSVSAVSVSGDGVVVSDASVDGGEVSFALNQSTRAYDPETITLHNVVLAADEVSFPDLAANLSVSVIDAGGSNASVTNVDAIRINETATPEFLYAPNVTDADDDGTLSAGEKLTVSGEVAPTPVQPSEIRATGANVTANGGYVTSDSVWTSDTPVGQSRVLFHGFFTSSQRVDTVEVTFANEPPNSLRVQHGATREIVTPTNRTVRANVSGGESSLVLLDDRDESSTHHLQVSDIDLYRNGSKIDESWGYTGFTTRVESGVADELSSPDGDWETRMPLASNYAFVDVVLDEPQPITGLRLDQAPSNYSSNGTVRLLNTTGGDRNHVANWDRNVTSAETELSIPATSADTVQLRSTRSAADRPWTIEQITPLVEPTADTTSVTIDASSIGAGTVDATVENGSFAATIQPDVSSVEDGTYTLPVTITDEDGNSRTIQSTSVTVAKAPEQSVAIEERIVSGPADGSMAINVSLVDTDRATISISHEQSDYRSTSVIEDDSGDGTVTVQFDPSSDSNTITTANPSDTVGHLSLSPVPETSDGDYLVRTKPVLNDSGPFPVADSALLSFGTPEPDVSGQPTIALRDSGGDGVLDDGESLTAVVDSTQSLDPDRTAVAATNQSTGTNVSSNSRPIALETDQLTWISDHSLDSARYEIVLQPDGPRPISGVEIAHANGSAMPEHVAVIVTDADGKEQVYNRSLASRNETLTIPTTEAKALRIVDRDRTRTRSWHVTDLSFVVPGGAYETGTINATSLGAGTVVMSEGQSGALSATFEPDLSVTSRDEAQLPVTLTSYDDRFFLGVSESISIASSTDAGQDDGGGGDSGDQTDSNDDGTDGNDDGPSRETGDGVSGGSTAPTGPVSSGSTGTNVDIEIVDVTLANQTIEPDSDVQLNITVENAGNADGSETVLVTAGEHRWTTDVTVPSQERKTVSIRRSLSQAGSYTVESGDVSAGTLTVTASKPVSNETTTPTPVSTVDSTDTETAVETVSADQTDTPAKSPPPTDRTTPEETVTETLAEGGAQARATTETTSESGPIGLGTALASLSVLFLTLYRRTV